MLARKLKRGARRRSRGTRATHRRQRKALRPVPPGTTHTLRPTSSLLLQRLLVSRLVEPRLPIAARRKYPKPPRPPPRVEHQSRFKRPPRRSQHHTMVLEKHATIVAHAAMQVEIPRRFPVQPRERSSMYCQHRPRSRIPVLTRQLCIHAGVDTWSFPPAGAPRIPPPMPGVRPPPGYQPRHARPRAGAAWPSAPPWPPQAAQARDFPRRRVHGCSGTRAKPRTGRRQSIGHSAESPTHIARNPPLRKPAAPDFILYLD